MTRQTDDRNPLGVLFARYGESHRPHLAGGLLARGLSRIPDQLPNLLIGIAIDAVFLQDTPYRRRWCRPACSPRPPGTSSC